VRTGGEEAFRAVRAALRDPDPSVVAVARRAADKLRLSDEPPNSQAAGPKIEARDPDSVMTELAQFRGDRALGERLFGRLECARCHTVRADEPPRGPFLGTVAGNYKRPELAEAILRPNKSIAQGFATVNFALVDGRVLTG